jgi:hypothetical protein
MSERTSKPIVISKTIMKEELGGGVKKCWAQMAIPQVIEENQ